MRWCLLGMMLAACGGSKTDAAAVEPPAPSQTASAQPAADYDPCADEQAHCPFVVSAPKGWKAQHKEGMWIAQASPTEAVIAMRSYATPPTDAEARRRDVATALAIAAKLKPPEGYLKLTDRPMSEVTGVVELSLWEMSGAVRGPTTGAILVFSGQLSKHVTLVGIGYAPRADADGTKVILETLREIAPPKK